MVCWNPYSSNCNNALAITELPYGVTTVSLIESILAANAKGKIKIKHIDDNTSDKVELIVHLPAGSEAKKVIQQLYVFTSCQVQLSPAACVIVRDPETGIYKPHFLGVRDILKASVDATKELLKRELEIKLGELEQQWHLDSLERIFIEGDAAYVTYLEVARQAYWAALDAHADYRRVPFTLARVECDFRSEALVNEVLELGIRCLWIGGKSFAFGYLIRIYADKLAIAAGVVIIAMGLHFLGLTKIALMYREKRVEVAKPVGLLGAYVMGLAFAFGWTPCIGPILAVILAIAASEATVAKGAGLLAIYSLGLGIPFLIASLAVERFAAFLARFRAYLPWVERTMGALLVLTGIAFLTGFVSEASYWLLEAFPVLGRIG